MDAIDEAIAIRSILRLTYNGLRSATFDGDFSTASFAPPFYAAVRSLGPTLRRFGWEKSESLIEQDDTDTVDVDVIKRKGLPPSIESVEVTMWPARRQSTIGPEVVHIAVIVIECMDDAVTYRLSLDGDTTEKLESVRLNDIETTIDLLPDVLDVGADPVILLMHDAITARFATL